MACPDGREGGDGFQDDLKYHKEVADRPEPEAPSALR